MKKKKALHLYHFKSHQVWAAVRESLVEISVLCNEGLPKVSLFR